MQSEESFALSLLPRKLAGIVNGQIPNHRKLYEMVLNGQIPAHQENGRWRILDTDVKAIAAKVCPGARRAAA